MQTQLVCRTGGPFQSCSQLRPQSRSAVVTRATSDPMLRKPEPPARPSPPKPSPPAESAAESAASAAAVPAVAAAPGGVTLEYQRQQAKAMQQYFKSQKFQATVEQAKAFGWTKRNEINNGRWVMMGVFIGLLTEYATGVSFVEQIKMMISFLGIADVYD